MNEATDNFSSKKMKTEAMVFVKKVNKLPETRQKTVWDASMSLLRGRRYSSTPFTSFRTDSSIRRCLDM